MRERDNSVIDPVCGREVKVARAASFAQYRGLNYYFCSVECGQRFCATLYAVPAS